jgi:hypothetical protein
MRHHPLHLSKLRSSNCALLLCASLLVSVSLSSLSACAPAETNPVDPPAAQGYSMTPNRAVFSGVKTSVSSTKTVEVQNANAATGIVTALSVTGADAAAFVLEPLPSLPLMLAAGKNLPVALKFVPSGKVGMLKASLKLELQGYAPLSFDLAGLSTQAEQGEFEPPLAQIVKVLGYGIDVGGTDLILDKVKPLIGQEVTAPLFQKTGTGPVTLNPVARYSPDDLLTFGYFTLKAATATVAEQTTLNPVGILARKQEQTLNPALDSSSPNGGKLSFDPASAQFGIYVAPNSYSPTGDYTLDRLNTGPLRHAVRVYPLADELGKAQPGSYLLAFEAASNGDYQDYVFVLSGAEPVAAPK